MKYTLALAARTGDSANQRVKPNRPHTRRAVASFALEYASTVRERINHGGSMLRSGCV
jgi:hypothetical protein